MPVRPLPPNPNLDHLKHQAKDLLKEHAAGTAGVAQRLREFHSRFLRATDGEILGAKLTLSDAQLAIARERGFPSWTRLKRHIEKPTLVDRLDLPHHERIEDPIFRRAVDLIDAGDVAGLRAHLKRHPKLVRQHIVFEGGNYFHNPALLEFVAENPVRYGRLPANIADVARAILDAGPEMSSVNETLMLAATGSVPSQCSVQIPLIDVLCDFGADASAAARAVALHGELDALHALIRRGGLVDLPVAAALGDIDQFKRLLPSAGPEDRHLAFAMAAQYGHVEIVRALLDAGEDPNRYNPIGGHSHTTPLHQAALRGNVALARLLVERGARLDQEDVLWHGTPEGWARHEGKMEVAEYLRAEEGRRLG